MSEFQLTPSMGTSPAALMAPAAVGTEERSEMLELFGRRVKVVPEAIRALWLHQLANVEAVQNLESLRTDKWISEEAFTLLIRKFQDGSPGVEGLDRRIAKSDLEFVASVVGELKQYRTAAEVSMQIDRALFLGDVAKLRILHSTGRLGSGLVPVNASADRIRLTLAAFAGRRDAMLQLQVPSASQGPEETPHDASDNVRHGTDVRSVPQQSVNLQAMEPRPVVSGPHEGSLGTKRLTSPTVALVTTGQTSSEGNPLFALQFFQDGRLVGQFRVVSKQSPNPQSHRSHGDSSSHSSETDDSVSQGGDSSINSRGGTGGEATRWFVEARPTIQESQPGRAVHADLSPPTKNDKDGTDDRIKLVNQLAKSGEDVWLPIPGKADATERIADIR